MKNEQSVVKYSYYKIGRNNQKLKIANEDQIHKLYGKKKVFQINGKTLMLLIIEAKVEEVHGNLIKKCQTVGKYITKI